MKKFHIWAVAAAIFVLNNNKSMHYDEICSRVIDSNLSTLGEKGKTPKQSIGAILRKNHELFTSNWNGYYQLNDIEKASKNKYIIRVIEKLKQIENERHEIEDMKLKYKDLTEKHETIKKELKRLKFKFKEISKIANSAIKM